MDRKAMGRKGGAKNAAADNFFSQLFTARSFHPIFTIINSIIIIIIPLVIPIMN